MLWLYVHNYEMYVLDYKYTANSNYKSIIIKIIDT